MRLMELEDDLQFGHGGEAVETPNYQASVRLGLEPSIRPRR